MRAEESQVLRWCFPYLCWEEKGQEDCIPQGAPDMTILPELYQGNGGNQPESCVHEEIPSEMLVCKEDLQAKAQPLSEGTR